MIFIGGLFVGKFILNHEVIFKNMLELQTIGDYILNDFWKIPNLIMNAKDYFINNTSFKTMSPEF